MREAHKIITPEEYEWMQIVGWHEVCRDIDAAGNFGIRFLPPGDEPLEGEFFIDIDKGHVVFRPGKPPSSFANLDQVWAVCTTGEGWPARADRICELLNATLMARPRRSDELSESKAAGGKNG